MAIGDIILFAFLFVAIPLIFIGVPVFVFSGGLRKFALKPLQRACEGIETHDQPRPGDVSFVYHTYRGFLMWFVQEEHRVSAPPEDALVLLKRLLRFNLTWGMMSRGILFIPLLAVGNYFAQKRSIQRQRRNLAEQQGWTTSNSSPPAT
jgi:hypothetical protein